MEIVTEISPESEIQLLDRAAAARAEACELLAQMAERRAGKLILLALVLRLRAAGELL